VWRQTKNRPNCALVRKRADIISEALHVTTCYVYITYFSFYGTKRYVYVISMYTFSLNDYVTNNSMIVAHSIRHKELWHSMVGPLNLSFGPAFFKALLFQGQLTFGTIHYHRCGN
jgi:hypothetical protein